MKFKKIAAVAAAAIMAAGVCTGVSIGTENISSLAITAEAANSDFVIKTDKDGDKYVAEYKGKGGDIKIPSEASYVTTEVFNCNGSITNVTFPENCTMIDGGSFAECVNLKKVVFEGDAAIGVSAFEFCINLESVTVKGSIWAGIYESAFWGCQNLKTVKISKNTEEFFIGGNAFRDCFSLKTINIPSKCTDIYGCAFFNCFSLEKLTIPAKTNIVSDDKNECNLGYVRLFKTKDDFSDNAFGDKVDAMIFVADGKTSGYFDKYKNADALAADEYDDFFYTMGNSGEIYLGAKKYTPKKLTLTVTKGSSAEKWAKANKVKYTYASSSSSSGSTAAPANIKASKTNNSVTLTWDAVDGADMYRVYKYNDKTQKYEKYKDVKSAKCTISGLSANTKYKFKVTAYDKVDGKYVKGESSKAVSVTTKK